MQSLSLVFAGIALFLSLSSSAQTPRLTLHFSAEAEKHADAAKQSQKIWDAEGSRIVDALEAATGLKFEPQTIQVILHEGPSVTGSRDGPMRLNVAHPVRMSLPHELGHRLTNSYVPAEHTGLARALEAHKLLDLYLYDVWVKLYGKNFAAESVATERSWKALGFQFIDSAWEWALSMTEAERAAKLRELVQKK